MDGWYEAPELTMPPSEYFRRNCWISVEADEETVPHFIETFGDERLIFSTDYPHGDSKFPHAVDAFDKLPMTDETQGHGSSARTGRRSTRSRSSKKT